MFSPETYGAVMAKKGKPNGVVPLDGDGKIDAQYIVTVEDETLVFHKTDDTSE